MKRILIVAIAFGLRILLPASSSPRTNSFGDGEGIAISKQDVNSARIPLALDLECAERGQYEQISISSRH
jgi:hypothetical protein